MRRLNVRFSQIEECIRSLRFALDSLPRNPPLSPGEPLLLQLTRDDAAERGMLDRRIEYALIFERAEPDPTGQTSRHYWPNAGKIWKQILICSGLIPTIPFALERLGLSRDYGGQSNAVLIDAADEAKIQPLLGVGPAEELRPPASASIHELLIAIRNHDTVVRLSPIRNTRVMEHDRRLRDPWLGNALKMLYDHKCQICIHDFRPRYNVPYADTRLVKSSGQAEDLVSTNLLVLCPNHDAIIGAARPTFDARQLAFKYSNGLVERVTLRDHLL
jgi:hypothetical protein